MTPEITSPHFVYMRLKQCCQLDPKSFLLPAVLVNVIAKHTSLGEAELTWQVSRPSHLEMEVRTPVRVCVKVSA
ncbi:unnamed protein product [Lota lota]